MFRQTLSSICASVAVAIVIFGTTSWDTAQAAAAPEPIPSLAPFIDQAEPENPANTEGVAAPGVFTKDLDIPFSAGRFDLTVPAYGGYDNTSAKPEEPGPLTEQTIYIPYEDLRKTFEKEGRGVFLPYAKFRQLWDRAQAADKPDQPEKPPVGALITETTNTASVKEDVVEVDAVVQIELLSKGWHEVPLRLSAAAITSSELDGAAARIVRAKSGDGYQLLVHKKDDKAERKTLTLKYAKAINRSPGHNSVSFDAPQAPVSRWTVKIPESGVKVDFYPLIAATEVQADGNGDPLPANGTSGEAEVKEETVVLAFVGAAPTVRIGWTPKAEGATGLEALATVQSEQRVTIAEGVTRVHTVLNYAISRAELDRLAIEVPLDWRVVNVFDANIRGWSVAQGSESQTIDVQLFEPAKTSQAIIVELEKFGDELEDNKELKASVEIDLPVIRSLGVGRQQGIVVVGVGDGLTAETSATTGLMQLDRGELPQALESQQWDFAFRYATVPFTLSLAVEKVQPRITVDTLVEVKLRPLTLTQDVSSVWTIERAGVFELQWDLPDGYDVRRVVGRQFAGAAPVDVESHHVETVAVEPSADDGGEESAADDAVETADTKPDATAKPTTRKRLIVNLSRKAIGKVGLYIELYRLLDEPDLTTPGSVVSLPLEVPTVVPTTVQRASGRLMVFSTEGLRVNPTDVEGFRTVSFEEALEEMQSFGQTKELRPVLAFAYGEQPETLTLDIERRKPQVTVRQMLAVKIEDGVVKYHDTLFYDVKYSNIKSLRVDIPAGIAATLRNDTESIRDSVIDPAPDDLEEGYVAWQFTGGTELYGTGKIELSWEQKLEQLSVGGSVDLDLPELLPQDVDRSWGQIVLSKAETIDLFESGETVGLRQIDPSQDLMQGVSIEDAAEAFEFHGPWDITITATRYELAEVKRTSIERAVMHAVVNRSESGRGGTISIRALYSIRSTQQRLQLEMPVGAEFNRDPMINGHPAALETEVVDVEEDGKSVSKTLNYIQLLGTTSDVPFLLELRYLQPNYGNGDDSSARGIVLDYPTFPTEPAMQEMFMCVYLPEEWDLVGSDGPWTKRFDWDWDYRENEYQPGNEVSAESRIAWVADAVPGVNHQSTDFPVDGTCYIFSTLQPGPSDTDALKLSTIRDWLLNSVILVLGGLIGLVLLPAGASQRVITIGLVAVGIIVVWIFWPLLGYQITNQTLYYACVIIGAIWLIKLVGWTMPRYCRSSCGCWKEAWRKVKTSQKQPVSESVMQGAATSVSPFKPGSGRDAGQSAESGGGSITGSEGILSAEVVDEMETKSDVEPQLNPESHVVHSDDPKLADVSPTPYVLEDLEKKDEPDDDENEASSPKTDPSDA